MRLEIKTPTTIKLVKIGKRFMTIIRLFNNVNNVGEYRLFIFRPNKVLTKGSVYRNDISFKDRLCELLNEGYVVVEED